MAAGGNWKEMFHAAEQGDVELVRYHLDMGVDPDYQHPEYMTSALLESIRKGKLEVVELLLCKSYPLLFSVIQYSRYPFGDESLSQNTVNWEVRKKEFWYSVGENLRNHFRDTSSKCLLLNAQVAKW